MDIAAINNSALNCTKDSCSIKDGMYYVKVCKPFSCPLWKTSSNNNVSLPQIVCHRLPCTSGCSCSNSKMNCVNRHLNQFPKHWIIPYQK
ncbi:hypothetical protein TrispH2_007256, partial [Trichoplax sp. H2]